METQTLFDMGRVIGGGQSGNPRQSRIDAALDHADEAFRVCYKSFALAFAASHGDSAVH